MTTFTVLGACLALVAGAASSHWTGMPVLLAYLVGVNLATFGLYAYDKSGAKLGLLRVPENTLHLFALAGGTPSALMAQGLLRHKTVKRKFRIIFWAVAAIQIALLAWLLWSWR